MIDRVVLRPGAKRGQIEATLYGELGTVLSWTATQRDTGAKTKTPTAEGAAGVSSQWLRG